MKVFENDKLRICWFASIGTVAIIPIILSIFYAPIEPDSGYFLSIIERLNEGYVPYKDFQFGYTPIVIYIGLFLKKTFSIGINYEFYLIVHFIFQIISAFVVFKITATLIIRKDYAFYSAILFLLASHWNGGNAFLFETPSLLFGLAAIYITISNKHNTSYFIIIGVLVALSFLSKQYGFGFFFLIIYLIIFNPNRWRQIVFFVLGFSIPILALCIIWGKDFIPVLVGGTSYSWNGSWLEKSDVLIDRMFNFFLRIFPVLIISIFYLPTVLMKNDRTFFLLLSMLVFGLFGFMAQFLFGPFSHYYLYIIPFASILSFVILDQINTIKWFYMLFLIITIGMSFYSTFYNRVYKIYINSDVKKGQYLLANKITKLVGNEKNLYILNIGLIPQYYLTNTIPPNLSTIGYTFGISLTYEKNLTQVNSSIFVLKYAAEYNDYTNNSEINGALVKRNKTYIDKDVILYR